MRSPLTESELRRDQDLWERWGHGDSQAGAELLSHYDVALASEMVRHGLHLPEEREEAYEELVLALADYKNRKPLEKSFFGLARTMLLSIVLRRRERSHRDREMEPVEDVGDPRGNPGPEGLAFREALEHCMDRLHKPMERELFLDRYLMERGVDALAEQHGKSRNHISVLIYRAVKQMRECLSREGFVA